MDMAEYERLVEQRARQMMASDTVTTTVKIPTTRAEIAKTTVTEMVPTVKSVYTEEQVKRIALEERARPENKVAEVIVCTKEVDDFEYQVITSTEVVSEHDSHLLGLFSSSTSYTITHQKVVKTPIKRRFQQSEVQFVPQPVALFEGTLRNQVQVVEEEKKREVEKVSIVNDEVERTVTTARNDLSHYKEKAAKKMVKGKAQDHPEDGSNGP